MITGADIGNINNILLIKLDHIGDFITSLPAIKLTRLKYPNAKITLLVGTWNLSIAQRIREVDEVITFDFFNRQSELGIQTKTPREWKDIGSILLSNKFDMAIDLRRHPETRGFLILSGAKVKVGYFTGNNSIDTELSIAINPPNEFGVTYVPHISTQLYDLVNMIGKETTLLEMHTPEIMFSEKEISKFNIKYKEILDRERIIGINPGVGSIIRQWPLEYYSELIDLFIDKAKSHIIILGSPSEVSQSEFVYDMVKNKNRVTNLTGQLSIGNFILFVKRCRLFIGNNSGSGHISGIMNTPTLILFSGQVHASEWHPLGNNTHIINNPVDCSPCYLGHKSQCTNELKCLTSITPEEVYQEGVKILDE